MGPMYKAAEDRKEEGSLPGVISNNKTTLMQHIKKREVAAWQMKKRQ